VKNTRPPKTIRQKAGDIKNTFLRFFYALALAAGTAACSAEHYPKGGMPYGEVALSESTTLSYWYAPRKLRTDQNAIGEIKLTRESNDQSRETSFFIRRIPQGYAAEMPLNDHEIPAYFSVSHDSEQDFFAGLRFRMRF